MEHFVCIDIKFNYEYNFFTSPRIQAIYSFTLSILAESVKNILERMQTMWKEEHTTANRENIQWNQPKQNRPVYAWNVLDPISGKWKGERAREQERERLNHTVNHTHDERERVL